MSLLTDEEIGDLLDLEKEREYPCSVGSVLTVDVDAVVEASQTLTLKAVAEWLGEYCDNPKHESQAKRIACIRCLWELQDAGTFGKMPGGE